MIEKERKTKETDIRLCLDLSVREPIKISTGVPFFDHVLGSMSFHGGFALTIDATGDIEVDPHHLVEDVGLVLGEALRSHVAEAGPVARYGASLIPMDDALSEVAVDVCERPYLVFSGAFPQETVGTFHVSLVREFLLALANRAAINLHASCRYGENSHHMIESLFKALGRAIASGYRIQSSGVLSTKGRL